MNLKFTTDETFHSVSTLGKQLFNNLVNIITDDEDNFNKDKDPFMITKKDNHDTIYNIFLPGVKKEDIVVYIENNQIIVNAVLYLKIFANMETNMETNCVTYKKYINVVNNMKYNVEYKDGILKLIVSQCEEPKEFLKVD